MQPIKPLINPIILASASNNIPTSLVLAPIALNTPIQGTSADIIKKAMVEIDKEFKDKNIQSKMILQVHDELIFDVIESEKKIVEEIVKRVMTSTISLSVPLKVSADYGKNWYDIK